MSDVNVNLKPCACGAARPWPHQPECAATESLRPVLIPCPIPRAVTFEVALGRCTLDNCYAVNPDGTPYGHAPDCPARPIKVSCSISGETWEESEVDPESIETRGYGVDQLGAVDGLAVCRARWALVKALVLGRPCNPSSHDKSWALFRERDVAFSALADMARAEIALHAQWQSLPDAIKKASSLEPYCWDYESTPTTEALAAYVAQVIEQVGVMQ